MSDVYDSDTTSDQDNDDVHIEDNDTFQDIYTNAQNKNETLREIKANKYVVDDLPEKEARLQNDEVLVNFSGEISVITGALVQELILNNTLAQREILSKI